jgi:beta-lactamase regulating signal transducer with metallopeptidase domain
VQCVGLGSPWRPQWWFAWPAAPASDTALAAPEFSLWAVPEALALAPSSLPAAATAPSFDQLVVLFAAIAMLGGLGWLVRVQWRLRRLLSDRRPESCSRVLTTAAEVARRAGLQQSPQLSRSERIRTPIAFGLLRPEICLPARVPELGGESLRAMLAHEVAHLRGHDPAWMWGAAWLQALFPWQLLLVAVRRRWTRLVELRCDAIAGEQCGSTAVARCLLDVAGWLQPAAPSPLLTLGMASRPSALRERVEAALHGAPVARSSRLASAMCGSLVLGTLTFGAPGVASTDAANREAITIAAPNAPLLALAGPLAAAGSSSADAIRAEHAALLAEAEQLRVALRGRRLSPELRSLQQQLESRLVALQRLQTRLQAVLSRSESR